MAYQWGLSIKFAIELPRFPQDLRDKIFDFTDIFEQHGLGDPTKYPGKIAESWKGLSPSDPVYQYTYSNDLWHYHIGYPVYQPSITGKYFTSDWLLHFQWKNWGNEITLVDAYQHYRFDGSFHLPPEENLDK